MKAMEMTIRITDNQQLIKKEDFVKISQSAAEVMAFEIDDRLVPILADTLRDFDNVTVKTSLLKRSKKQLRKLTKP